jgi:uncharacterized protein involved in exopolysaccharide biosynthesis
MATEVSLSELSKHAPPSDPSTLPRSHSRAEDEISVLDLLITLAKGKRTVFAITAGFAVLAIIVSLILPKRFTATVTLLPPQQNNSLSSMLTSQLGNLGGMAALAGGGLGIKNPNEMYVAMLKSRTVEDAMVERYNLSAEYHAKVLSEARKEFEHKANVDGSGKDGLIRISIDDSDPNRAAELANGYVDQFRKLSEHLAISEASQRRLFFEEQLQQAKNNLADAEEAMKRTEQQTGLIQLDSQARALIESAAALRAQIVAKEVQIKSLQTFATGENAQLVQAQQELDGLRTQLARLGGSETISDAGIVVPKGKVPEAGLEYARRLRDVKYYETIFEILARQYELAKLDEAREGALIQVVDAAIPPDRRSFPKRGLIVMGVTAVGFIVGLVFVLLQQSFENMRSDPETSQKLGLIRRALSFRRRADRVKL